MFYSLPQLDLSERLLAICPDAITRCMYVSSGAEAIEGAIKLAHRATGRTEYVSTTQSFHGRTLGGLRIIGTERHESRRIDNQLRGRSGRQGDPGSSRFYLGQLISIAGPKAFCSSICRLCWAA